MKEDAGDDVLPGQPGDSFAHPEKQWAVGCGGVAPDVRHRTSEDVVDAEGPSGTDRIGIESAGGDLALREIRVDVAAEHRGRDAQRQDPQQERPVQLRPRHPTRYVSVPEPTYCESAEEQPGQHHHDRADHRHGQCGRRHPRGKAEYPDSDDGVLKHRLCARSQRTERHHDRSGGAETSNSAQLTGLGFVQAGRFGLVAVKDRNTGRGLVRIEADDASDGVGDARANRRFWFRPSLVGVQLVCGRWHVGSVAVTTSNV